MILPPDLQDLDLYRLDSDCQHSSSDQTYLMDFTDSSGSDLEVVHSFIDLDKPQGSNVVLERKVRKESCDGLHVADYAGSRSFDYEYIGQTAGSCLNQDQQFGLSQQQPASENRFDSFGNESVQLPPVLSSLPALHPARRLDQQGGGACQCGCSLEQSYGSSQSDCTYKPQSRSAVNQYVPIIRRSPEAMHYDREKQTINISGNQSYVHVQLHTVSLSCYDNLDPANCAPVWSLDPDARVRTDWCCAQSETTSPYNLLPGQALQMDQPTQHDGSPTPLDEAHSNIEVNPKTGKLWQFLLALLHNTNHNPRVIRWEDFSAGQFKFVQSDEVVKMWGRRKGFQTNMTYEKLCRAMRYYYKRGILKPVIGKKLVYAFGPNTVWSRKPTQFAN